LLFLVARILTTYNHYGVGWDESDNRIVGKYAVAFYQSKGRDLTYFDTIPEKNALLARGHLIDTLAHLALNSVLPDNFSNYHLLLAMVNCLTFIVAYMTLFLLTRNPFISTLSLFLMYLMPRYYGHIFNDSKNTGPMIFFSIYMYKSILILKHKKPEVLNLIISALTIGIAASLRFVFIYAVPVFLFTYGLSLYQKSKLNKRYFYHSFIFLMTFILTIHLFSPYLIKHPIFGLIDIYKASKQYPWLGHVMFEGKSYLSTELPKYYLVKWLFISIPIPTLIFISVGFFFSLFNLFVKKNIISMFLLLLFVFPILFVTLSDVLLYASWIHMLFLVLPMILFTGIGISKLLGQKNFWVRISTVLLILINVVLVGKHMISNHPFEYVYFNTFVGGIEGADRRYELEWAGRCHKNGIRWLSENEIEDDKTYFVYTCGHPTSSSTYLSKNMFLTNNLRTADYFVCYTTNSQNLLPEKHNIFYSTIKKIKVESIPLCYVRKRIKGK